MELDFFDPPPDKLEMIAVSAATIDAALRN
jgi:hypothetical protein